MNWIDGSADGGSCGIPVVYHGLRRIGTLLHMQNDQTDGWLIY